MYMYIYVYIYIYYIYIYINKTNLCSDVKISKMFPTKPNQTVLFLFSNLSKTSQPGST